MDLELHIPSTVLQAVQEHQRQDSQGPQLYVSAYQQIKTLDTMIGSGQDQNHGSNSRVNATVSCKGTRLFSPRPQNNAQS